MSPFFDSFFRRRKEGGPGKEERPVFPRFEIYALKLPLSLANWEARYDPQNPSFRFILSRVRDRFGNHKWYKIVIEGSNISVFDLEDDQIVGKGREVSINLQPGKTINISVNQLFESKWGSNWTLSITNNLKEGENPFLVLLKEDKKDNQGDPLIQEIFEFLENRPLAEGEIESFILRSGNPRIESTQLKNYEETMRKTIEGLNKNFASQLEMKIESYGEEGEVITIGSNKERGNIPQGLLTLRVREEKIHFILNLLVNKLHERYQDIYQNIRHPIDILIPPTNNPTYLDLARGIVISFDPEDFEKVLEVVREVASQYDENQVHFLPELPRFTYPIEGLKGVGFCEEPRQYISYGKVTPWGRFLKSRVQILYQLLNSTNLPPERFWEKYATVLIQHGINPQKPFMNIEGIPDRFKSIIKTNS
ncbi:hypothetical protein HRbin35_00603 [bacterium HR35]|nr:hypothetical protein HRbin35_00603 [bacterium HR35]